MCVYALAQAPSRGFRFDVWCVKISHCANIRFQKVNVKVRLVF